MAKSNASGLLTSLDSLITTQEQRDAAKRDVVLDLPLDQIGDFPNHPFKVRQDEAMMEMMESVQLHGGTMQVESLVGNGTVVTVALKGGRV